MDDNQFHLRIWQSVLVTLCVIAVTIGGCTVNMHNKISADIHAGIGPLEAACAHGLDGSSMQCAVIAAKR